MVSFGLGVATLFLHDARAVIRAKGFSIRQTSSKNAPSGAFFIGRNIPLETPTRVQRFLSALASRPLDRNRFPS